MTVDLFVPQREHSLSTTPENKSREEDKDSGLELEDYSPGNNSEKVGYLSENLSYSFIDI